DNEIAVSNGQSGGTRRDGSSDFLTSGRQGIFCDDPRFRGYPRLELGKVRYAVSRRARQTFGFISGSSEGPAYSDRAIAIERADQARGVCPAHLPSYREGGG